MCNPNSSIANRRQRSLLLSNPQVQASMVNSTLLQKGVGANVRDAPVERSTTEFLPPMTMPKMLNLPSQQNAYNVPTTLSVLQQYRFPTPQQEVPVPKKPKRRRKPQKPGKTAKQNDRHFVVHNYHDHANDVDEQEVEQEGRRRGGVSVSFPLKLHAVLDQVEADGLAHVVSWQPHGRCFVIHNPKEFTNHIMPNYFRQTKLTSFQRQLNLYGFNRLTRGNDAGGYYHELFLRGKPFLCKLMVRTKVKGTKFKAASSPDQEPNFYTMPPVITPQNSDCENSEDGHRNRPSLQKFDERQLSNMQRDPRSCTLPIGDPARYQQFPTASTFGIPTMTKMPEPSPLQSVPSGSIPVTIPPTQFSPAQLLKQRNHSEFLDDAVDELFLGEARPEVNESVLDFVNIWDPASFGADAALENDTQLGNLLDKLLSD